MTLEWLLIIGAIAGLAAVSVLAVQNVIDDSTDLPPRPDIRIIDAEIQAAQVASEATEERKANPLNYVDSGYSTRCNAIPGSYTDVVSSAVWTLPTYTGIPPNHTVTAATCVLTRR